MNRFSTSIEQMIMVALPAVTSFATLITGGVQITGEDYEPSNDGCGVILKPWLYIFWSSYDHLSKETNLYEAS